MASISFSLNASYEWLIDCEIFEYSCVCSQCRLNVQKIFDCNFFFLLFLGYTKKYCLSFVSIWVIDFSDNWNTAEWICLIYLFIFENKEIWIILFRSFDRLNFNDVWIRTVKNIQENNLTGITRAASVRKTWTWAFSGYRFMCHLIVFIVPFNYCNQLYAHSICLFNERVN